MKIHGFRERLVLVCLSAWLFGVGLLLGACASPEVAHNMAGNEHFSQGAYDRALEEYRLAQLADPRLAVPYFNAANSHNRRSQLAAVVSLTAQALKTADPGLAADVWYNLGNALFDAAKWPEAIVAYQEALRINPKDRDAKHNLELSLRKLEEQRQDDKTVEEKTHSPDDARPSETGPPPPDPVSPMGQSADQNQLTPEPGEEPQAPDIMSREQAERLLEALVRHGETLQKRLNRIDYAPGAHPEKDW